MKNAIIKVIVMSAIITLSACYKNNVTPVNAEPNPIDTITNDTIVPDTVVAYDTVWRVKKGYVEGNEYMNVYDYDLINHDRLINRYQIRRSTQDTLYISTYHWSDGLLDSLTFNISNSASIYTYNKDRMVDYFGCKNTEGEIYEYKTFEWNTNRDTCWYVTQCGFPGWYVFDARGNMLSQSGVKFWEYQYGIKHPEPTHQISPLQDFLQLGPDLTIDEIVLEQNEGRILKYHNNSSDTYVVLEWEYILISQE